MKKLLPACLLCSFLLHGAVAQVSEQKLLTNNVFTLKTDRYGIGELSKTNDVHATNYIRRGRVFGEVTVRYFHARKLDTVTASMGSETTVSKNGTMVSSWSPVTKPAKALNIAQTFSLDNNALTWQIKLHNTTAGAIRVEDNGLQAWDLTS